MKEKTFTSSSLTPSKTRELTTEELELVAGAGRGRDWAIIGGAMLINPLFGIAAAAGYIANS